MNHSALKRFAQETRKKLIRQISTRLDYILTQEDPYIRAHGREKQKIESLLDQKGREELLEETAYIWFNRLTALRFMDNRGYNPLGIVSPAAEESQPRLLAEIKEGRISQEIQYSSREILELIDGTVSVSNPDREAYKTALLAWCNYRGSTMPYLFERIDDWAALLLPQDLLSEDSVIHDIQENILPEDCKNVEIIGWLYQYYISERKDQVFAELKKKKKITPEKIPAATQLFTPEWIVRYMVENSLGRLWLNNNPQSSLKDSMKYYVETQAEAEFLKVKEPEEIKLLDPSCGSGHILVYAFDILYRIYEEEGYSPQEIPQLIIQHNLYGVDIDDRAAALASFALSMKAREKDRTFLESGVLPNVIASQNVEVDYSAITITPSRSMQESLEDLKQAKNLGSLIPVDRSVWNEISSIKENLSSRNGDMHLQEKLEEWQTALTQLKYLSPRYHCVVTNPPYMASKGMNEKLKNFLGKKYSDSKSDLFSVFIEKGLEFSLLKGYLGMINQQSWMFLSSFKKLRSKIFEKECMMTMAHLGAHAFDSIGGEVVQTTSFVMKHGFEDIEGCYHRLISGKNENEKELLFLSGKYKYSANASDFFKIPGYPIAYWVSEKELSIFERCRKLSEMGDVKQGIKTGNNDLFLRYWFEVSYRDISFDKSKKKWFPCTKGGSYRKWFGNFEYILNWQDNGHEIKNYKDSKGKLLSRPQNIQYFFQKGITWSSISSGKPSFRFFPENMTFESKGPVIFLKEMSFFSSLFYLLNTKVSERCLQALAPTLDFSEGAISRIPTLFVNDDNDDIDKCIEISQKDWNSFEESWDYISSPLLKVNTIGEIKKVYHVLQKQNGEKISELTKIEEEINRVVILAYNLEDELAYTVPKEDITLTCNPHYRYGSKKSEEELESLLLQDTMKELISYATGCMFGRYSLDKPGLILANAQDKMERYLEMIPEPSFRPDKSGILPITEEDDFTDDLTNQFKAFLKVSFGEEHFEENLRFVEEAIGKDIRSFFLKDFYKDHLKRYKKRPIYWMITSPSGSLRALIYLHRYNKDTVSVFLNDYLRPYQSKLGAKEKLQQQTLESGSASAAEKARAQKALDKLQKVHRELEEWERDVVYPLATQRIELDLDDGVKVNYGKLGSILEVVKGLNG